MECVFTPNREEGQLIVGPTDAVAFIDLNWDFTDIQGAMAVLGLPDEVTLEVFIDNVRHIFRLFKTANGYTVAWADCHCPDHVEFDMFTIHAQVGTAGQLYHPAFTDIWQEVDERGIKGMNRYVVSLSIMTSPHFADHIANLRIRGVKRVFVIGLALNYCVIAAAEAYAGQGFEVIIVRDATRSVPHPVGEEEQFVYHRMYGHHISLVNADQLVVA